MEPNPQILCHPNIPKPLHGVNPRTIYGKDWWDEQRQTAYKAKNFHCFACGVHKSHALFHKWLEAHEFYLYDYKKGRIVFDHLVALCHACHNYIHDGRMKMMVDDGRMTQDKYEQIMRHGYNIVCKAGLKEQRRNRHSQQSPVEWADWRMVVDGKEYGPSTQSFHEWQQGGWKNWKPKNAKESS